MGRANKDIPYLIVVGCGFLGSYLAGKLSEEDNDVMVVDQNKDAFEKLPAFFGGFVLNRDANNAEFLLEAGVEKANAVIAVTGNDNLNMFVSAVAKDVYHVEHVLARVCDPKRKNTYLKLRIKTICAPDLWLDAVRKEVTR